MPRRNRNAGQSPRDEKVKRTMDEWRMGMDKTNKRKQDRGGRGNRNKNK